MARPYTITLDPSLTEKLRQGLISRGFEMTRPAYMVFSGKGEGVVCSLYESGKLVVQGKQLDAFIQFFLEPEILQSFSHGYEEMILDRTCRIGIDESGKGDLFGPLCVAGVYGDEHTITELSKIGVRDSKTLKEKQIALLARDIRSLCRHHIVRISPSKYNELYASFKNLNRLLAWGHATAIEQLAKETQCHTVVIDQFAAEEVVETALARKGLELTLTQRHRGEEDIVVAAASILARQAFVDGLHKLSQEFGLTLPKGASALTVDMGRQLVAKHGPDVLPKVAKMHFRTVALIV